MNNVHARLEIVVTPNFMKTQSGKALKSDFDGLDRILRNGTITATGADSIIVVMPHPPMVSGDAPNVVVYAELFKKNADLGIAKVWTEQIKFAFTAFGNVHKLSDFDLLVVVKLN